MEIEAGGQASLHLLETWRRRNVTSKCHERLGLRALDLSSENIAQVPRFAATDPLIEAILDDDRILHQAAQREVRIRDGPMAPIVRPVSHARPQSAPCSKFSFTLLREAGKPLDIRAKPLMKPRRGVKRRRLVCDVDGFNTAGLSLKKRRLRGELITSRLSQPYSQPATHILNREGQETGDKRFLKMATSVDMARRIAHLHSTSFLRYSTMNRLRMRLGLGQAGAAAKHHDQESTAVESKKNSRPQWKPPSLQASSAGKSLRVCAEPSTVSRPQSSSAPSTTPSTPSASRHVSAPARQAPTPPSKSPAAGSPKAQPTACRLSQPAALPRPATDFAATKRHTSPRIHPIRSPEIKPSVTHLEDLEEDSFAFLHAMDDDWDDQAEDQEGVYSDFGLVFQQPAAGVDPKDERTYEEYLDELDGICWVSR